MQISAIRHRPESEDAFLYDPEHMRVRLHTAKDDIQKVTVIYNDPYMSVPDKDGVYKFEYKTKEMKPLGEGQANEYWGVTLSVPYRRIQYLFEIEDKDGQKKLLGDRGFREDNQDQIQEMGNYFKLPYFHEIDMAKTPAWVKNTVWYQIFPERFANGDKSNDPENVKSWNPEDHPGREDFYGGDLQGVLDHLDDLQELGVNGLYFCPIFKATSNHKYDTVDYKEIDPAFGDKKLFKKLVQEAHKRGMKIMLDAVFNHIGVDSPQWQDVVKNGENSKYADWFHINYFPVEPYKDPLHGEGEPQYDTFGWEKHMPKWNTANPEVKKYLLDIATYWVKEFDIDAWRLDVANEVDHQFWKDFRKAVDAIKPDFYIVGEIWHSSQNWLSGDEFTGTMNYPFTQQINDHFLERKTSAKEFTQLLIDQLMLYRSQVDQGMLNMLDSHDTARILTEANNDENLAFQALAFMFLQTGSPCIYYGTEMAMTGENDPDCRKPMDWSKKGGQMWKKVSRLIKFRHDHEDALSSGITHLSVTPKGLIKVERIGKDETVVGYFNTSDNALGFNSVADLYQNYLVGQLLPEGFIIRVDKH